MQNTEQMLTWNMLSGAVHCIDTDMEYAEHIAILNLYTYQYIYYLALFNVESVDTHMTNTNDNKSYFMCFFLFFFFTHVQADTSSYITLHFAMLTLSLHIPVHILPCTLLC